jgi:hypothetical protein
MSGSAAINGCSRWQSRWRAPKITLLAVWDGLEQGDSPGGTVHMVSLARAYANVDIKVITTAELLEAASGVGS